jgi:hypothetical protein
LQFNFNNVYRGLPVVNAAAFSDPGPWAAGNEPRYLSGLRGDFRSNEDIAFAKNFFIKEGIKVKLEIEFFNILNRVVFDDPNTLNLNDPNFGLVTNRQKNSPRKGQGHIEIRF